jgi:hypothetical protein
VPAACNVFSTDVNDWMYAKITEHTWGRIEGVLDCAFDLFRFAIAWLGRKPEPGRRESDH